MAALFVHLCDRNSRHAVFSVNLRNGVRKLEGNTKILQALLNISGKSPE